MIEKFLAPPLSTLFAMALSALLVGCGGGDNKTPNDGSLSSPVTTIAVSLPSASIGVGEVQTLSAIAKDQNGVALPGQTFNWTSSNTNVATVANGVVTGIAAGTTVITASSGNIVGQSATLTIAASATQVAAIAITPLTVSIGIAQSQTFIAQAKDQNGAVMTGVNFTWTSTNANIATVANGVAAGIAVGTTQITASVGSVTSNAVALTVIQSSSVVISKPWIFLTGSGQSNQLTAQLQDSQGARIPSNITWTSTAPDKISVDATGKVTANAIGSAQIIAESNGIRSAPTLVFVATPAPGAVLVTDAQVISIGTPLNIAAGTSPGVGTEYEVKLQGVNAPIAGTVLLAAETAPIAGKVISTRQDVDGLAVRLALAPLYEIFSAYDINWTIDLSAFPLVASSAQTGLASASAAWSNGRRNALRVTAAGDPLDAVKPFRAFECDASIKPSLIDPTVELSPTINLNLVVIDSPGYSKHTLEGSASLGGRAGMKLAAGFKASGKCEAAAQFKIPALGVASAIIMPAVRFGLGAELSGEVILVQGEAGVEGKVGVTQVVGWECGGATPVCRGIDDVTPINEFKPKWSFPGENGMQAKVSGHFYALAGLDLAIFGGFFNAKILEGKFGPKQSFDLASPPAQAARTDYASNYDLKMVGVVEPGDGLKKAIELVIHDDNTNVKFKATSSLDISSSPTGTLSANKSRVALGSAVDFTVDLNADTLTYFLLGYNVTGVELYRKREDENDFTDWKSMTMVASNHATYHWETTASDAGKYEFAAFVNTQVPVPLLEVSANSIFPVEVSCFTAGASATNANSRLTIQSINANETKITPQANTCADTWSGTSALAFTSTYTAQANVTWTADPAFNGPPNSVRYFAEGTADITILSFPGCSQSPMHIVFDRNDPLSETNLIVNYDSSPPSYSGRGGITREITMTCPNGQIFKVNQTYYWFSSSGGKAATDGLTIDVSGDTIPEKGSSFHFVRP